MTRFGLPIFPIFVIWSFREAGEMGLFRFDFGVALGFAFSRRFSLFEMGRFRLREADGLECRVILFFGVVDGKTEVGEAFESILRRCLPLELLWPREPLFSYVSHFFYWFLLVFIYVFVFLI